jgi:hypothetical protein
MIGEFFFFVNRHGQTKNASGYRRLFSLPFAFFIDILRTMDSQGGNP